MRVFNKQPADKIDYQITLTDWLDYSQDSDGIEDIEVSAPDDIDVLGVTHTETFAKVWVQGGKSGESYKITALITTRYRVVEVDFMISVTEI